MNFLGLVSPIRGEAFASFQVRLVQALDASAKREINRIIDETVADPVGPEFMAPPEYA